VREQGKESHEVKDMTIEFGKVFGKNGFGL